ncbi:MAG: YibE/F family protein, partial [Acidimicrobiia bacterium]
MTGPNPDFEKLIGPDRRSIDRPSGLAVTVIVITALTVVGLFALWPTERPDLDLSTFGFADQVVRAETIVATKGPCSYDATYTCRMYRFDLLDDPVGEISIEEFPDQPGQPDLQEGDKVFLAVVTFDDGTIDYQYAGTDRRPMLVVLGLLFAGTVVGLGRLRGVAALLGLVVSLAILLWFILPAIIDGEDAVLVALVGGGAIALVALYLAHGYNPLTHVAALGAFAALFLTVALSWVVLLVAGFTGLASEEAFYLLAIPNLDFNGLLLAGIVLGAIGA